MKCSVEECQSKTHARGMCGKHYRRWHDNGHTDLTHGAGCPDVYERFAFFGKRAESGCLEWTGILQRSGYARTKYNGVLQMVHRVAWQMVNGPIPDGLIICHKCDNRKCFEVSHLFLGTHKDNAMDCFNKRRHPCIRLTKAEVAAIRESNEYSPQIAARFDISASHANAIRRNVYWVDEHGVTRNRPPPRTHCRAGHAYAADLRHSKGGKQLTTPWRICRICVRIGHRRKAGWPEHLWESLVPRKGFRPDFPDAKA